MRKNEFLFPNMTCSKVLKQSVFNICSLQTNESLKALRLTGNKIGNRGGMALAQMLQVNTTLEALDVADCDLVCLCNSLYYQTYNKKYSF